MCAWLKLRRLNRHPFYYLFQNITAFTWCCVSSLARGVLLLCRNSVDRPNEAALVIENQNARL